MGGNQLNFTEFSDFLPWGTKVASKILKKRQVLQGVGAPWAKGRPFHQNWVNLIKFHLIPLKWEEFN